MTVLLVGTFANIDQGAKRRMGMCGRTEATVAFVVEEIMSLCDHIFCLLVNGHIDEDVLLKF